MKKIAAVLSVLILITCVYSNLQAQKKDKGKMIEYKNEFWDKIKDSADEFAKKKEDEKLSFKMDFEGYDLPDNPDDFKKQWHNEPISQGWSGMCWCFSTTSFLESEVYRINKKKMKFSELFTVYWEYVEKVRRFMREHGDSYVAEGSQANSVIRIWKKYGCVPAADYTGFKPNQEFHDHRKLSAEIKKYLESVKKSNSWNEDPAIETVKTILNHYIGVPPEKISVDGKEMTPAEYLKNVVKLNMDDYVDIMSLFEKPYWETAEYPVPDNWWHSDIYYNVPLNDFMGAIKKAAENGFTMFIGGDVSESGYFSYKDVAVVPTYDIPSDYIDEYARQFRFSNKSTTDDHGIHLVGYRVVGDDYWFIIKDSGSGSRNGKNKGYYFYHEDFLKLKMMNFLVHKSAVKELLGKFK